MPYARINSAAVGIQPADDHVVETDECSEYAHCRDQPKRCVSGDGKSQANHVGLTGAPVAVQNGGRAFPVHIARTLNVCWDQLIRLKRGDLARRGASLCKESIPRLPLPFNDADEVSCRAGAIKCSRCRASFAPIRTAFARAEFGSPVGPATRRSIKRNKELAKSSDRQTRQSSEPLAAGARAGAMSRLSLYHQRIAGWKVRN